MKKIIALALISALIGIARCQYQSQSSNYQRQPPNQQQNPYQQQGFDFPSQNSDSNNYQSPSQNYQKQQTPLSQQQTGRISEIKCREYSNLIKKKIQVTALSLDSVGEEISVNKCAAVLGLIVGGVNVNPNEFPHQCAIGYPNFDGVLDYKCGGSLISDLFVLTAAHCNNMGESRPSVVRLGDLNLRVSESGLPEIDIQIERFISHERYDKESKENDIAVIKMRQPVAFSKSIRPACLHQSENLVERNAVATGWGYTSGYGDDTADVLQKVKLDIIDNQQCKNAYEEEGHQIFRSQLCAGSLKGGKDTCRGDSGGPLQVTVGNDCIFSIVGVTSYGSAFCGGPNSPGIYTRVSSYLDWIENKVWKS